MDEALKLLVSFAKFVREEYPDLAQRLMVPVLKWATREKIPLDKLSELLKETTYPRSAE